jgi:hypothetical protein
VSCFDAITKIWIYNVPMFPFCHWPLGGVETLKWSSERKKKKGKGFAKGVPKSCKGE